MGFSFLLILSASSFMPFVNASLFFSRSNSLSSPPTQTAANPVNQSQIPPTSLPPGTATSIIDSPPPISSSATNNQVEPSLTQNATTYVYTTSFGLYKFSKILPYILSVSASNSARDFVLGSTFLVNSTTPLGIVSPIVLSADNHNFTVRYSVQSGGVMVGRVTIGVEFSKSTPPKISARLDSVLTNFNLEWIVIPSVRFARFANGSILDVLSYPSQSRLHNQLSYLEIGDANATMLWSFWGKIDWSSSAGGTIYVTSFNMNAILSSAIMVAFPKGQSLIDPSILASTTSYMSGSSTQRRVFFYNNLYWAFWFDLPTSNIYYRTSASGLSNDWSPSFLVAYLPHSSGEFDVAQTNSRVFLAWLDTSTLSLMVLKGYISGSSITWGASVLVSSTSTNPATASANVVIGSDGYVWVGGASGSNFGSNFVLYRSTDTTGDSYPSTGTGYFPYSDSHDGYRVLRSQMEGFSCSMPPMEGIQSRGGFMVLEEFGRTSRLGLLLCLIMRQNSSTFHPWSPRIKSSICFLGLEMDPSNLRLQVITSIGLPSLCHQQFLRFILH